MGSTATTGRLTFQAISLCHHSAAAVPAQRSRNFCKYYLSFIFWRNYILDSLRYCNYMTRKLLRKYRRWNVFAVSFLFFRKETSSGETYWPCPFRRIARIRTDSSNLSIRPCGWTRHDGWKCYWTRDSKRTCAIQATTLLFRMINDFWIQFQRSSVRSVVN